MSSCIVSCICITPNFKYMMSQDAIKFIKDNIPDVELVIFLPPVDGDGTVAEPLDAKIWSSSQMLARSIRAYVSGLPSSLQASILILPTFSTAMPSVCSLNLLTNQSYAYGGICDGAREQRKMRNYMRLLDIMPLDDLCTLLINITREGIALGSLPPLPFSGYEAVNSVFGCLQLLVAMWVRDFEISSENEYVQVLEPVFATLEDVRKAGIEAPTPVSATVVGDIPPVNTYCVYGRFDADELEKEYPGDGLRPCSYTVGAVHLLQSRSLPYVVVNIANARDPKVPPTKPDGHTTVPVIFYKSSNNKLTFIGGKDALELHLMHLPLVSAT